jgi:hypothetical protein
MHKILKFCDFIKENTMNKIDLFYTIDNIGIVKNEHGFYVNGKFVDDGNNNIIGGIDGSSKIITNYSDFDKLIKVIDDNQLEFELLINSKGIVIEKRGYTKNNKIYSSEDKIYPAGIDTSGVIWVASADNKNRLYRFIDKTWNPLLQNNNKLNIL